MKAYLEIETVNPEMLTPSLAQAPNRTAKGAAKQRMVKALETTAGGRFSGSRNMCAISGLGPATTSYKCYPSATNKTMKLISKKFKSPSGVWKIENAHHSKAS